MIGVDLIGQIHRFFRAAPRITTVVNQPG